MSLTIAQSVQNLANAAKVAINIVGMPAADALDTVAYGAIATARDAHSRTGAWSRETSTETIEDTLFQASVARDILDNNYRPSVGNVRDYALRLLSE